MPARNSKGRFVKGGGSRARRSRSSGGTTAIVVAAPQSMRRRSSSPRRIAKPARRRRGGKRGGGINLLHVGAAALGVAYLTGEKGPAFVRENVAKIPGAKTFGAPAALGLGCLAVDRFVKPNKWLKLAGITGIVLAASQVGKAGTLNWVGDADDADVDVGDIEDVGDYDDEDDDE